MTRVSGAGRRASSIAQSPKVSVGLRGGSLGQDIDTLETAYHLTSREMQCGSRPPADTTPFMPGGTLLPGPGATSADAEGIEDGQASHRRERSEYSSQRGSGIMPNL